MKRTLSALPLFALALVLCFSLLGCGLTGLVATEEETDITEEPVEAVTDVPVEDATSEPVSAPAGEYGAVAHQWVEALTNIGPRLPGSTESTQAEQYIEQTFQAFGYETEVQPFTAVGDDGESVESSNMVAVKKGASAKVIVVGAHYDSSDESLGADDNASGVAVLIETASLLKNVDTPYTIDFVAFGAEEAGLLGSQAFVGALDSAEIKNIVLFVNMDSISAGNVPYIYSPEDESQARDWAMDWANSNGFAVETIKNIDLNQDGEATADYAAFQEAGIPWIYFEATDWTQGNEDGYTQVDTQYGSEGAIIHTEYDNLEYLDATFPGRVEANLNLYVNVLYHILTEYQP